MVGTKIIAEAWDAAGLYQVGTFIGHRWAEWNGRYRDDVRRFLRGDDGTLTDFVARIVGSPDIYTAPDHALYRSINFITCHDGFTLNDLVSYNEKHNEANGEGNRDGVSENWSWNYGHEGETDDPEIERLRERQIKNAVAVLLASQGTPMLLYGDEVRRTQGGNNNAYCQDNETGWFNWEDVKHHQGLLRFVQRMIRFNQQHPILNIEMYPANSITQPYVNEQVTGLPPYPQVQEHVTYHGVKYRRPDWGHYSHSIALTLNGREQDDEIHIIFNAYWQDLEFELPPYPKGGRWLRVVDTARPAPQDILDEGCERPVDGYTYVVGARSVVILLARDN
jgi:glycogen operon protein